MNERIASSIFRPSALQTSRSVLNAAKQIFGERGVERLVDAHSPGPLFSRLLVCDKSTGRYGTIRGNTTLPKKLNLLVDIDYFAFNFLRAVSNASLTTGANLRSEPGLSISLQSIGKSGLLQLRSEMKVEPPISPAPVVMTRCSNIDFNHVFFRSLDESDTRVITVMSAPEQTERMHLENKDSFLDETLFLWPVETLSARKAIDLLAQQFDNGNRVLIEAGPSMADSLLRFDIFTMFLTILEEDTIDIAKDSLPFFDQDYIRDVCGFELLHECHIKLDSDARASYLLFSK